MLHSDTIAAISTAPGGGVGMVRITGPEAISLGRQVFTPSGGWKGRKAEPRFAIAGRAHRPRKPLKPIDHCIFTCFKKPGSYTGEDTVELTTHGGAVILGALLQSALDAGARLAEPGEFTRRAYLNGRLDLAQAEAVAGLVAAATEEARRVMLCQLDGALSEKAARIKDNLTEAKVVLEAAIDFPEDVGKADESKIKKLLDKSKALADELLSTSSVGIALSEGLSVAIAGTPNVGKSSLLNALARENRAIVHELPGTTRDFIEARVEVRGVFLRVLDTAGIRDDADEVEVEGILRTKKILKAADLIIVLLDGSREAGPGDRSLLAETTDKTRIVAINKTDLPQVELGLAGKALEISAKTGLGLDSLRDAVYERCFPTASSRNDAVVTSIRQREALEGVSASCDSAMKSLKQGVFPELLAVDLDEALMRIGDLVGEVTSQEVLDRIFSNFCIGK